MKKYLILCPVILGLSAAGTLQAQTPDRSIPGRKMTGEGEKRMADMNKLRDNLKRMLIRRSSGTAKTAGQLLEQIQKDGSLAGMNYHQEKVRGSAWAPYRHLFMMQTLAATHPEVAGRMLDFWIRTDAISENWWWPEIGIPAAICKTMLLLDRKAEKGDPVRTILDRSRLFVPDGDRLKYKYTGQNNVWLAGIHLMKGLLYDDPAMVEAGRDAILSEICISDREGLQSDWSYHQHGAQLQFGNYGLSWFEDMVFWTAALSGTGFAFPPEQTGLITKYYANGLRWTLSGRMMDINACGRQLIGSWPYTKYRQVRRSAALLQEAGLLEKLPEPEGSICYPRSGYLIHRCGDYFFSVRMCSRKLIGSETCNSENMQGLYAGDGATMLYPGFRWHQASLALRDWYKVPGATELQNPVSLVPSMRPPHNSEGDYCCFAEGNAAAAMMKFRNPELQADKAWFCFGKYIVCMGGKIRAAVPGKVATTLVQSLRSSPVLLAGKALSEGTITSSGKTAFTFEGMKYLLPENGDFHFLLDHRKGNWNTINFEHPSTPVSGKMLTVWQEHEADGSGRYLYVIYPEKEPAPKIEYLRGGDILGIRTTEGFMAAFFKPGKISGIESGKPGLLLDFKGIRKFVPLPED